jgi:hypothetical protein
VPLLAELKSGSSSTRRSIVNGEINIEVAAEHTSMIDYDSPNLLRTDATPDWFPMCS